jgi:hypothetical protein
MASSPWEGEGAGAVNDVAVGWRPCETRTRSLGTRVSVDGIWDPRGGTCLHLLETGIGVTFC